MGQPLRGPQCRIRHGFPAAFRPLALYGTCSASARSSPATRRPTSPRSARAYDQAYADTYGKGYICIPSGNHDMIRMRDTLSEEQMKLAFLFLLTMRAAHLFTTATKSGMRYVHGLCPRKGATSAPAHVPRCSGTAPPTPGSPPRPPRICICPSDPDASRPCVAAQRDDPESLYATVRALTALRRYASRAGRRRRLRVPPCQITHLSAGLQQAPR